MRYTTPKDIEHINEVARELGSRIDFSWKTLAAKTKWSETTVRKYYDKDWFPGKYYKKPIKVEHSNKDLEYAGLYMLAQQIVENGKIINLIKVGKSTNLRKRLDSYHGMNPFAKCIATKKVFKEDLDKCEKDFHLILGVKNTRYGNTEWFICSDEEYAKWHEMGLK